MGNFTLSSVGEKLMTNKKNKVSNLSLGASRTIALQENEKYKLQYFKLFTLDKGTVSVAPPIEG